MFYFLSQPRARVTSAFQPLAGIRVLDLSRYLPGPFTTRILGDLGAEIYKVEALSGDSLRWVPPMVEGKSGPMGAAFASVNAGKKSIALDARKPAGRALLHALIPQVDILVESFRPGILARFGLDDATLEKLNPRLITCSLSGYGQTGPLSGRAGHDLNYLARAGILGLFGPPDAPPQVPGVQLADLGGGALPATIGILAALLERNQTGKGRRLDISLTRSATALGTIALSNAAAGQEEPRGAGFLTGGLPCYRCYPTADGRYLALGALEPEFFAAFCAAIERPDLATLGYAMGAEAETVAAQISAVLAGKTLDVWMQIFGDKDVCVEPVLTPQEALAAAPELVSEADGHTILRMDLGVSTPAPAAPPALGADGLAVCTLLGVDPLLIAAAQAAGVLL